MLSTCWLLFLLSAVVPIHRKPSHLVLSWPGHLMQHSITLLLGKIALTQPVLGVLGHCPVEKQMIVPLSANQISPSHLVCTNKK